MGCKQLTPSPLVSRPPSSATTTTGPGPATCMYWTPWVNTNTPDATGDYETIMHLNSLVQSCNSSSIRAIECRTVGSRKSWNEAGDMDVKCDLDSQGLLCFNKVQRSGQCQDYEIRVFCDECPSKNSNTGSLDMRLFLLRRIKQIFKKLRILLFYTVKYLQLLRFLRLLQLFKIHIIDFDLKFCHKLYNNC